MEVEEQVALQDRLADLQPLVTLPTYTLHTFLNRRPGAYKVEASIRFATAIQSTLQRLLTKAVGAASDDANVPRSLQNKRDRLAPRFLQLALRTDRELSRLITRSPTLTSVCDRFLDSSTAALLQERSLRFDATVPPAAAPPPSDDDDDDGDYKEDFESEDDEGAGVTPDKVKAVETAMIKAHDASAQEWNRRKGDPITDADLAAVLQVVHPAYQLPNDALVFLGALARELVATLDDAVATAVAGRPSPGDPRGVSDLPSGVANGAAVHAGMDAVLPAALAKHARSVGDDAVDLMADADPPPADVSVRFKHQNGTETVGTKTVRVHGHDVLAGAVATALRVFKKEAGEVVLLHRGRPVNHSDTPAGLGMRSSAVVFAMGTKWWANHRREAARRGLLTSSRANEVAVKSFKMKAQSKVSRALMPADRAAKRTFSPIVTPRDLHADPVVADAAPVLESPPVRRHRRRADPPVKPPAATPPPPLPRARVAAGSVSSASSPPSVGHRSPVKHPRRVGSSEEDDGGHPLPRLGEDAPHRGFGFVSDKPVAHYSRLITTPDDRSTPDLARLSRAASSLAAKPAAAKQLPRPTPASKPRPRRSVDTPDAAAGPHVTHGLRNKPVPERPPLRGRRPARSRGRSVERGRSVDRSSRSTSRGRSTSLESGGRRSSSPRRRRPGAPVGGPSSPNTQLRLLKQHVQHQQRSSHLKLLKAGAGSRRAKHHRTRDDSTVRRSAAASPAFEHITAVVSAATASMSALEEVLAAARQLERESTELGGEDVASPADPMHSTVANLKQAARRGNSALRSALDAISELETKNLLRHNSVPELFPTADKTVSDTSPVLAPNRTPVASMPALRPHPLPLGHRRVSSDVEVVDASVATAVPLHVNAPTAPATAWSNAAGTMSPTTPASGMGLVSPPPAASPSVGVGNKPTPPKRRTSIKVHPMPVVEAGVSPRRLPSLSRPTTPAGEDAPVVPVGPPLTRSPLSDAFGNASPVTDPVALPPAAVEPPPEKPAVAPVSPVEAAPPPPVAPAPVVPEPLAEAREGVVEAPREEVVAPPAPVEAQPAVVDTPQPSPARSGPAPPASPVPTVPSPVAPAAPPAAAALPPPPLMPIVTSMVDTVPEDSPLAALGDGALSPATPLAASLPEALEEASADAVEASVIMESPPVVVDSPAAVPPLDMAVVSPVKATVVVLDDTPSQLGVLSPPRSKPDQAPPSVRIVSSRTGMSSPLPSPSAPPRNVLRSWFWGSGAPRARSARAISPTRPAGDGIGFKAEDIPVMPPPSPAAPGRKSALRRAVDHGRDDDVAFELSAESVASDVASAMASPAPSPAPPGGRALSVPSPVEERPPSDGVDWEGGVGELEAPPVVVPKWKRVQQAKAAARVEPSFDDGIGGEPPLVVSGVGVEP